MSRRSAGEPRERAPTLSGRRRPGLPADEPPPAHSITLGPAPPVAEGGKSDGERAQPAEIGAELKDGAWPGFAGAGLFHAALGGGVLALFPSAWRMRERKAPAARVREVAPCHDSEAGAERHAASARAWAGRLGAAAEH